MVGMAVVVNATVAEERVNMPYRIKYLGVKNEA